MRKTASHLSSLAEIPIHPFLIAIFPVLSLYAHNITQVAFASTLRALAVFLAATGLGFGGLWLLLRSSHRAALTITWGLVLFILVVPIQIALMDAGFSESVVRIRFLLPVFGLLFLLGLFIVSRLESSLKQWTTTINVMLFVILIIPLAYICEYQYEILTMSDLDFNQASLSKLNESHDEMNYPDVYFIVLDTHAATDAIYKASGFDNTKYLEKLKNLGFTITPCSKANYPMETWQSLAATLNMNYLDHASMQKISERDSTSQSVALLQNNQAMKVFKQHGYRIVTFKTQYDFLNFANSDTIYDFLYFSNTSIKRLNRFETMLLQQTPMAFIADILDRSDLRTHYELTLSTLDQLIHTPMDGTSPKFVYAHIMVPHPPYVFTQTGHYDPGLNSDEFSWIAYNSEVAFIDMKIAEVAGEILRNSEKSPIIIIQGDHGFGSVDPELHSSIFSAYYLPGVVSSEILYPDITPVNNFRLIFKYYLHESVDLLPDRTFFLRPLSKDKSAPYSVSEYSDDSCQ